MLRDLASAVRSLRGNVRLLVLTVVTLALGIGANTAVFTVVSGVLLRSLPYRDASRLVRLTEMRSGSPLNVSYPNFVDWRARARSLEAAVIYNPVASFVIQDPHNGAQAVPAACTERQLFDFLGQAPVLGRTFSDEEAGADGPPVAVISYRLWTDRFGQDPAVIGRALRIDTGELVIVGVLPTTFDLEPADVWVPISRILGPMQLDRGNHPGFRALARLRPEVTLDQAQKELNSIARDLQQQYPSTNRDVMVVVTSLSDAITGRVRPMLWLLLGAVGLVLLVACANVANMLLARATGRVREGAIRSALGASRLQLIRLFLIESFLLSVLGGAAGLLAGAWAVRALKASAGAVLPRADQISVDSRVVAFTAAIAILTTVLFGMLPALRASRGEAGLLRATGRNASSGRSVVRSSLVATEVSLAIVLLVGAGLMLRTMVRLAAVDPGFDTDRVLAVRTEPPADYSAPDRSAALMTRMIEAVSSIPGTSGVAAAWPLDLVGFGWAPLLNFPDHPLPAGREPSVALAAVTTAYFSVLRIPVLAGRTFDDGDASGRPIVAVVNREFANRFYPGQNAIGRRITFRAIPQLASVQIVGIVGNTRRSGLAGGWSPEAYVPWPQFPQSGATLVVKGARTLPSVAAIRTRIVQIDPRVAIVGARGLADALNRSVADRRWFTLLLGLFALVAVALSIIGVAAVVAHDVSQRTRELAIRIALGAQPDALVLVILRQMAAPVVIGVFAGGAVSWVFSGLLRARLFGVAPRDPLTYAAAAALLMCAAFIAAYLPAHRATRVDPLLALKAE